MAVHLSTKQSEIFVIVQPILVSLLEHFLVKLISKQCNHEGGYIIYISSLRQVSSTICPPDVLAFNLIIFHST